MFEWKPVDFFVAGFCVSYGHMCHKRWIAERLSYGLLVFHKDACRLHGFRQQRGIPRLNDDGDLSVRGDAAQTTHGSIRVKL